MSETPRPAGRYREMDDKGVVICRECSTRSHGVMIPADERTDHDRWHAQRLNEGNES